ncbi:response regulator transcription factor [uncultured Psychroserpens sp.]|uniref:response regulator n=1 Tax=uncultured Psychroserpens sp. TaxID=255436 RepID=UPI002608E8FD|nr:response regulator transcription factor [uncultured Psychroserpens sp.]
MPNLKDLRVLVADDHPLILRGMTDFLKESMKADNIICAKNGKEALELLQKSKIDLVLLDIHMPYFTGLEVLKIINDKYPKVKVIMITFEKDIDVVKQTLRDGAVGYLLKEYAISEVEKAIEEVLKGNKFISEELNRYLIDEYILGLKEEMNTINLLTGTEKTVLKLIVDGNSAKEIAEKLFVSSRTVEAHKKSIMSKFNIHNTILLVRHVIENKLLDE